MFALFAIILITVCTLGHVYVFRRIAGVSVVRRRFSRFRLILAGVLVWIGFVLGVTLGHDSTGWQATLLETVSMSWLGILFLLFVCFFAVDLVTGFGRWGGRLVPWLRSGALAMGCLLAMIAFVQGWRAPVITDYRIRMKNLSPELDGTVVVALSDTHLGAQLGPRWLAARVEQVRKQSPDLIVLLGDIYEGHGCRPEILLPVLRRLQAPLGVWGVLGNHEFYGGERRSQDLLEKAGIQVLRNRCGELQNGLVLAGVDDLRASGALRNNPDLVMRTLKDCPSGAAILLSHTPEKINAAAEAGADLMLCGHTHGGQIWPFGWLVRQFYPFLEGRHTVAEMPVIVCRGTGSWGPRMRLWKRGEILRLTLRSTASDK